MVKRSTDDSPKWSCSQQLIASSGDASQQLIAPSGDASQQLIAQSGDAVNSVRNYLPIGLSPTKLDRRL